MEKVTTLIFAGGVGRRMNSRSRPKQFLEVYGKPVIIHTLEHFEYHPQVDEIVIVCVKAWIKELKGMLWRFNITKVSTIVPGGETGHDSIYNGLEAMKSSTAAQDIVLIHDGVRPLISEDLIQKNIDAVRQFGNAITCERARESVVISPDGKNITDVPLRDHMYTAKAPQSFRYGDILRIYEQAQKDRQKSIDSAHLCHIYHQPMHLLMGPRNNLKITDPVDYYIYRALYEAMESQQIYGL